jgi:Mce-associated membrane protein
VIATGVLAFLLALTLALGIPYALQKRSAVHHNAALNTARSQTVDLARKVALATASYDYRHVTADLDKAMAYMTPSYKRVYQGIAAKLGPLVVQAKAISTGSVLNYGVRSLTTTHAVVVLFLDQNVKQDGSSAPARPSHYRAIITMDKLGGHWLVSLLQLT